jgi:hypothetical protein
MDGRASEVHACAFFFAERRAGMLADEVVECGFGEGCEKE